MHFAAISPAHALSLKAGFNEKSVAAKVMGQKLYEFTKYMSRSKIIARHKP
jgi:hypothetical protein